MLRTKSTNPPPQESQFKPGIPQYDAVFDPACGFLRRNRPNAAMKLLKKSTTTGKVRVCEERGDNELRRRVYGTATNATNTPFFARRSPSRTRS